MGLFDKLLGSKHSQEAAKAATERLIAAIKERSATPFARTRLTPAATSPTESKVGGMPYTPEGFVWPTDGTEGFEERPLAFLAQVNFAELPPLEGFPREGIAQFYISDGEHYGLDFEQPTRQRGFRVVFHERTDAPNAEPGVKPAPLLPAVGGEFRMTFEAATMAMTVSDYRFDKVLLEAYNAAFPSKRVSSVERIPDERLDQLCERLETTGHRVGGYPAFAQLDPREYHAELKGHTTLLLQIDSAQDGEHPIRWGDGGSCAFLARPEDLAKRDFGNVLYYWDCN